MKRVLVAGATGYLGRYLLETLKEQGFWVRALVRPQSQDRIKPQLVDELFVADVTRPQDLKGIAGDMDVVISALGLTKPNHKTTYLAVDERANGNLLKEAEAARVKRFVYVHIFNEAVLRHLPAVRAKANFVKALKASNLDHQIIAPTGYFSDMAAFQDMANTGPVILFDSGAHRINPIHGKDLAEFITANLTNPATHLDIGGPDTLSFRELAELAFVGSPKKPRVLALPLWLSKAFATALSYLTPQHIHAPIQFITEVTTKDMVAPSTGTRHLADFFAARKQTAQQPATNNLQPNKA